MYTVNFLRIIVSTQFCLIKFFFGNSLFQNLEVTVLDFLLQKYMYNVILVCVVSFMYQTPKLKYKTKVRKSQP